MTTWARLAAITILFGFTCCASAAETVHGEALRKVVADACRSNVVFLGEPDHHGSAKAIEFKSAVAEALIDKCGFSTIVFESSFYESLYVNHLFSIGKPVDAHTQLNVIGGVWTDTQEFRSFGDFLFNTASRGKLRLFGMDDQLSAGADLSAKTLPIDLSSRLNEPRASDCRTRLARHLDWRYTDAQPYTREDQKNLLGCLSDIVSARHQGDAWETTEVPAMADSLARSISRDFRLENDGAGQFNARDDSMASNYAFIAAQLKRSDKVIVWAATNHLAKTLKNVAGSEGLHSFGEHVLERARMHPFVVATSSLSGSVGRRKPQPLSDAPANSIEARAFDHVEGDVAYVDSRLLKRAGRTYSRMLGVDFQNGDWSAVVDAVIVFRQDTPVTLANH